MINYVACLYFQEYLSQIAVRVALICWGLKCIEVAFVLLTQKPWVRILTLPELPEMIFLNSAQRKGVALKGS